MIRTMTLLGIFALAAVLALTMPTGTSAQTADAPDRPARPVLDAVSHNSVTISWTDPDDASITGYQILRRDRAVDPTGTFHVIENDTASSDTTYADGTVEPSHSYVYRVKARNDNGLSRRSKYLRVDTSAAPDERRPRTNHSLSIAPASATEGSDVTFTVTLSQTSSTDVTVNYSTSIATNDTATLDTNAPGGADFTPITNQTLTIDAGKTSETFSVSTTDDSIDEHDETFTVTLSSPSGATLSGAGSAKGTINDNDDPAIINYSLPVTVEGQGVIAELVVKLEPVASGKTITVDWAAAESPSDSATEGEDFTASSGTLTFVPGDTMETIEVPILNDGLLEATEYIDIQFSNLVNVTIPQFPLGVNTRDIAINDDDTASVTTAKFGSVSYRATEGDSPVTVRVELSDAVSQSTVVNLDVTPIGGATSDDYSGVPNSVRFDGLQTVKTFTVRATDDEVAESEEGIRIELSVSLLNERVLVGSPAVTTIYFDDTIEPSTVAIQPASYTTEGEDIVFTVSIDPPINGFKLLGFGTGVQSLTGGQRPATKGEDYNAPHPSDSLIQIGYGQTNVEIRLSTRNDRHVEGTEYFGLRINPGSNLLPGSSVVAIGTIFDDENNGRPYVDQIPDDTGTHASINVGGTVTGRIEELNDVDWYRAALVAGDCYRIRVEGRESDTGLTLDNPRIAGVHRTDGSYIPNTRDGGRGRTAQSYLKLDTSGTYYIAVSYYYFNEKGTDNTYRLSLTDLGGSTACGEAKPGAVPPPVSISVADASKREWPNPLAYLIFEVTLSRYADSEVRVDYTTVDKTAVAGEDYTRRYGTLVFAEGERSKRIGVPIRFEEAVDDIETLSLILYNPRGAVLEPGGEVATGTIIDYEHNR